MNKGHASTPQLEAAPKGSSPPGQEWTAVFSLSEDPRWQLAQRIVVSKSFAKSALLSRFLLYVCEREITGRTEEVSEHQIGVQVFGRRPGYNPGEDNIVRNYARQLRQRLEHYFQQEGLAEELCVSIPRGTYVPTFSIERPAEWRLVLVPEQEREKEDSPDRLAGIAPRTVQEPSHQPVPRDMDRLPAKKEEPKEKLRLFWLILVLPTLLAVLLLGLKLTRRASKPVDDPSQPLWSLLFDRNHQTLLVPSDDGIVMIQNLTGHLVHLSEYISRDYLSVKSPYKIDAQNMRDLDAQRYTNVTDLNAVVRFSQLPEAKAANVQVLYARELRMENLKDANAILLGSNFSNPWVELFEKNLNFQFNYEPHPNASRIVNRHPQGQELPTYDNDAAGQSHRTYAVIALVPNLDSTGKILLVEGLTMAGTQAAVDILFNREAMASLLRQCKNTDGSLNSFEALIETRSFGSDSPQAYVIATRVYRNR